MEELEMVLVKLRVDRRWMYICNEYIPPCSPHEIYVSASSIVSKFSNQIDFEDTILVVGDFNLPHVRWVPDIEGGATLLLFD